MSITLVKKPDDFVYYRWERKENGVTVCSSLFGVPAEEKGYVYKALGHYEFEKNPIKVPDDYKLEEPNNYLKNRLETHYCREKRPEPNFDGLEIEDWEENAREKWLKVGDIEKLKTGDTIKVLVMDRNLYDITMDINDPNTLYTSEHFFSQNTATYVHGSGLQGKLTFHIGNNDDIVQDPFDFHVQYNGSCWYPLKNGSLPAEDEQGLFPLLDREVGWDEFPLDTPIGWRGPMVLWENVEAMPDIYWYEP